MYQQIKQIKQILLLFTLTTPGMLFAAQLAPITFNNMPESVFETPGQPDAKGYDEGMLHFRALPAVNADGTPNPLAHIHADDIDGDGDKEMIYDPDGSGWRASSNNGQRFNLKQWVFAQPTTYTPVNPGDPVQPLIIEGYRNGEMVAVATIPNGTSGTYTFESGFSDLDHIDVFFDTFKGQAPGEEPGAVEFEMVIDDLVINTVSASTPVFPKQGLWWDPKRSGHGIDVQYDGANLIAVWYTYLEDGTPTWYLASGPFSGTDWSSSLDTYTWDGSKATAMSVGTISFKFNDATHADLSWEINGVSGREALEFFVIANNPTANDYTGIWFESTKPGYGLSVSTQGDREFSVLYFYDEQGNPRWALGVNDNNAMSYAFDQYTQGFCPVCALTTPVANMLGTITREFPNQSSGTLSVDFNLLAPLSGAWTIDNAQISNLSNP